MVLLYEVGIWGARYYVRFSKAPDSDSDETQGGDKPSADKPDSAQP